MAVGIAEVLATRLSRLPTVTVVSQHAVQQLQDSTLSLADLGKKLTAKYIVAGTISKDGDKLRVTAKMTRVPDLAYVWSANYSGRWDQALEIDQQIASDAAKALGVETQTANTRAGSLPANVEAFQLWSKGHAVALDFINNQYVKSAQEPESLLMGALELDPAYVDAMVDLGTLEWFAAFPPSRQQSLKLAASEQWLRRALDLDPSQPVALSFLGRILFAKNQRAAGVDLIRKALAADDKEAAGHFALSNAYYGLGFWESSLLEIDRAIDVNPLLNISYSYKASALSHLGRPEEALATLNVLPVNSGRRIFQLGYTLFRQGKNDEAERTWTEARSTERAGAENLMLAVIEADRGNRAPARRVLAESPPGLRIEDQLLLLAAAVGDEEKLLSSLPSHPLHYNYRWLIAEPRLRKFARSPRFLALVQELYRNWQRDLAQFGESLPAQPPKLPAPEEYLRAATNGS